MLLKINQTHDLANVVLAEQHELLNDIAGLGCFFLYHGRASML